MTLSKRSGGARRGEGAKPYNLNDSWVLGRTMSTHTWRSLRHRQITLSLKIQTHRLRLGGLTPRALAACE
jgi:hypothetical protein